MTFQNDSRGFYSNLDNDKAEGTVEEEKNDENEEEDDAIEID